MCFTDRKMYGVHVWRCKRKLVINSEWNLNVRSTNSCIANGRMRNITKLQFSCNEQVLDRSFLLFLRALKQTMCCSAVSVTDWHKFITLSQHTVELTKWFAAILNSDKLNFFRTLLKIIDLISTERTSVIRLQSYRPQIRFNKTKSCNQRM